MPDAHVAAQDDRGIRVTTMKQINNANLKTIMARERFRQTYRNKPHPGQIAVFVHLPLLLAIQQIIVVLHANKSSPPIVLGDSLHHGKLVSPHGACADVMDLAALHEVVESFHRLCNRRIVIEAVDL